MQMKQLQINIQYTILVLSLLALNTRQRRADAAGPKKSQHWNFMTLF